MIRKWIGNLVREAVVGEIAAERKALMSDAATVLHDITYRMGQLREQVAEDVTRRITAADLNIAKHMLDGYLFKDNWKDTITTAGYVTWTDVNVSYKGNTYLLANGNTNKKYLYWTLATTPLVMQSSDTKPVLTADDILIGVNNGGAFTLVMDKMMPGAAILDGTVGTGEIGNNAVGTNQLASGAVTSAILGTGAVTSTALGANAVTAGKIATGAINAAGAFVAGVVDSAALGSNAVTTAKIATGAVTSNELGSNAVTAAKIAANTITSAQIANNTIGSGQIANNAIGTTQLASGAVTSAILGAGAVSESKLSLATHLIF